MGEILGQPLVILNRPGANGEIGTAAAASSDPNGYTLLFASTGPNGISFALERDLRYDPIKSFEPVTKFVNNQSLLVVRAALPARNLKELIDYAKANPGKLTYASAGTGSGPQITMENLKRTAGLDIREIPYPGMAPATVDLLGDRVDMMVIQLGSILPQVQAGKLRAMAVGTSRRSSLIPDVPTIGETVDGYTYLSSWFGLMAPARQAGDHQLARFARLTGITVTFAFVNLAVRWGFRGLDMRPDLRDASLETWAFSAVWGVFGFSLLVFGAARRDSDLRGVGLAMLMITLAKIFLFDMSRLDGVIRAASFLAVGALLLGAAVMVRRLGGSEALPFGLGDKGAKAESI